MCLLGLQPCLLDSMGSILASGLLDKRGFLSIFRKDELMKYEAHLLKLDN